MNIDALEAASLGWPKTKYASLERERRWLCARVPTELVGTSSSITDIYISGSQLRLREIYNHATGEVELKLTRKADLSPSKRIITTIYLSRDEFCLLSVLPGNRVEKTRNLVSDVDGIVLALDQFNGVLSGLLLAEAEFATDDEMDAYRAPGFLGREVTGDRRFTGGVLARAGRPNP